MFHLETHQGLVDIKITLATWKSICDDNYMSECHALPGHTGDITAVKLSLDSVSASVK